MRIHGGFGEPEPEPGDRLHREQVTGMRRAPLAAPAVLGEASRMRRYSTMPVAQRDVELQNVAIAAQAAVAQEIARIVGGEEILAGRERQGGSLGDLAMQLEIERRDRLLQPRQRIGRERLDISQRGRAIERAVAVDREAHAGLEHRQHRLDPPQIGGRARRRRS